MVALYVRVSTDAQAEEGYSIEYQKELLASFCKSKEYGQFEYYVDPGYSGSSLDRPAMQKLIEDCNSHRIAIVVVYKLDRLSRSQKDTLYLMEDVFNRNDVGFVSLKESFDTTTPYGKAMIGVLSVFSQLEREVITERMRMGRGERAKEGLWHGGGIPPYGYDYNQELGQLLPNDRAETVKKVFEMYVSGVPPHKIVSTLGFTNERVVLQILQGKVNAGWIVWNSEQYQGSHEPIVTQELFDEAARIMHSKRQRWDNTGHLLAGMIFCGKCGAKYRYQKWGKAGDKVYCYSQQRSKEYLIKDSNCDNERHWAEDIEEAVLSEISKISIESGSLSNTSKVKMVDLVSTINTRIQAIDKKIKNLISYIADGIEVDTTKEAISKLSEEKRLLETQLRSELVKGTHTGAVKKLIKTVQDSWEYLEFKEKRLILQQLIEKIVIDGQNIKLIWRDLDNG